MRSKLACYEQRWQMEATAMKHTYSFDGYGGFSNCGICDDDTQVNEYTRNDGLVVFLCKSVKISCTYERAN